jgi:hypothetical protein
MGLACVLLGGLGLLPGLFAQQPGINVYYENTDSDCRLDLNALQPVIRPLNPFFGEHQWNASLRRETMLLGEGRTLQITQSGCKRHHINFRITIAPKQADAKNAAFYAVELFNALNRVYFNDRDYFSFKGEFETTFIENFTRNGLGKLFNFPLANRTFMAQCYEDDEGAAVIKLEIITYVLGMDIKLPGIEEYLDDGWFLPAKTTGGK